MATQMVPNVSRLLRSSLKAFLGLGRVANMMTEVWC
jgi:hypothetical protein